MNLSSFLSRLKNLPLDKKKHLAAGALIALPAVFLSGSLLAMLLSAWAGIGKEIYDHDRPEAHSEEAWDAFATALGGVAVALVWQLVHHFFQGVPHG